MAATRKRAAKAKSTFDIYEHITSRMIEALEAGVVGWQKPWKAAYGDGLHRNFISKRAYRGINQWILDLVAASRGYQHPYWLSAKQVTEKGGTIREDQFHKNGGPGSMLVVFWKMMKITEKDETTGETKTKMVPLVRFYSVWHVEQCEGLKLPVIEDQAEFDAIKAAEKIVKGFADEPTVTHKGDRAFYSPMIDRIQLPTKKAFDTPAAYYATRFHEDAHSTGHETRVGRVKDWTHFGSDPYAKEELVAEMTSAFLCAHAGIQDDVFDNSAAYIANWLGKLRDDKKLVVVAAQQAQKAADHILGVRYTDNDNKEN